MFRWWPLLIEIQTSVYKLVVSGAGKSCCCSLLFEKKPCDFHFLTKGQVHHLPISPFQCRYSIWLLFWNLPASLPLFLPPFLLISMRQQWAVAWSKIIIPCLELNLGNLREGLGAGGGGDDRGWDGWMASPTQWTWVWVNSGSWWWTGRPGVLQFMGSQRVGHDWATELNWTEPEWKPGILATRSAGLEARISFSLDLCPHWKILGAETINAGSKFIIRDVAQQVREHREKWFV